MGGETTELVVSWILTTTLTFLIVIFDERKLLDRSQRERAWPPPSRDAAIVAFGVLSLLVHFMKTRGHFGSLRGVLGFPLGLLMGVVAILAVALVSSLLLEGVALLFGLP
jgi:hypothetical protein